MTDNKMQQAVNYWEETCHTIMITTEFLDMEIREDVLELVEHLVIAAYLKGTVTLVKPEIPRTTAFEHLQSTYLKKQKDAIK